MKTEEAKDELSKRFPSENVVASKDIWSEGRVTCALCYNFTAHNCTRVSGSTFEECFAKIDAVTAAVNAEISRCKILFRQF